MSTPAVSESLNPALLSAIATEFEKGKTADGAPVHDAGYGAAVGFMATAYESARLGTEAVNAIRAAQGDAGQERRLRASWRTRFDSTLKAHEDAIGKIDAEHADNEARVDEDLELTQAKTDVVRGLRAISITTRLRGMGSDRAFTFLSRAIQENDREVISAALVSPFAAGLTYEHAGLLRQLAETKFSPERVKRREAYGKLRATITRARDIFVDNHGSILGAGDSPSARAEKALSNLEGKR